MDPLAPTSIHPSPTIPKCSSVQSRPVPKEWFDAHSSILDGDWEKCMAWPSSLAVWTGGDGGRDPRTHALGPRQGDWDLIIELAALAAR